MLYIFFGFAIKDTGLSYGGGRRRQFLRVDCRRFCWPPIRPRLVDLDCRRTPKQKLKFRILFHFSIAILTFRRAGVRHNNSGVILASRSTFLPSCFGLNMPLYRYAYIRDSVMGVHAHLPYMILLNRMSPTVQQWLCFRKLYQKKQKLHDTLSAISKDIDKLNDVIEENKTFIN